MGSLQYPQENYFRENWLALIVDASSNVTTVQTFPKDVSIKVEGGEDVTSDPDLSRPSVFTYSLPQAGLLNVSDDVADLQFTFSDRYSLRANLRSRIPWNRNIPNGDGPVCIFDEYMYFSHL